MKVSVVIACFNDQKWLDVTLSHLFKGQDPDDLEVIVVDDGSEIPIVVSEYPVKVLRYPLHHGVGYAFDRGVFASQSDTIVLMGADVLVRDRSWLSHAISFAKQHTSSIGCSVCAVLSPDMLEIDNAEKFTYGATIRFFSEWWEDDKIVPDVKNYRFDALQASSLSAPSRTTEVPCLIGAFYVTTKSWYNHIHGWDTDPSIKLSGHQDWGSLEPWISIKTWLAGGSIRFIPELITGHVYHRLPTQIDVMVHRGVRGDLRWYNKLFIVETMYAGWERDNFLKLLKGNLRKSGQGNRFFELASKMIRQNQSYIQEVTRRNDEMFGKRTITWFGKKFGIETFASIW